MATGEALLARHPASSAATEPGNPVAWPVTFLGPPITPELWDIFERIQHSYGCTREFIQYFEDPSGATLAQVGPAGEVRGAFLYRCERGTAYVLGRFFAAPTECLAAFARAVFARHPDVARIQTDIIDAIPGLRRLGQPALTLREGLELRIPLPATVEEYERSLEPSFLRRAQYHERRLARRYPATRITTVEGAAIPRSWIADVVRLNHERRASKGSVSVFTRRYEEGIASVARARGEVTVLRDGERVCAGVINVRTGPDAYFWVIGHDSAYGKFSPGTLCLLASIRHCIAEGVRTFHLLQGESEYKRAVGGKPARLASYVVLRSWAASSPGDFRRALVTYTGRSMRAVIRAADRIAARPLGRDAPFSTLARELMRLAQRRHA
jgi:CelD/BcsL family acetyltransferase involved in cellulose biosynthesis